MNSVLIFFRRTSLEDIGRRAGVLLLINIVFLLAVGYLSYGADLLGVSLTGYRKMYRIAGWMIMVLIVLYVGVFGFDPKRLTTGSDI